MTRLGGPGRSSAAWAGPTSAAAPGADGGGRGSRGPWTRRLGLVGHRRRGDGRECGRRGRRETTSADGTGGDPNANRGFRSPRVTTGAGSEGRTEVGERRRGEVGRPSVGRGDGSAVAAVVIVGSQRRRSSR